MASMLNEGSVEKKLMTVSNTQDSIQSLSLWIIHHKSNHAKIVELWMKVLKKTPQPYHRLTLFYLCNDVVQNCKKKKAFVYNTSFKEYLREAACLVRDQSVRNKVERIFNIWGERGVYDAAFIKSLHSILNGQHIKSYKVHENHKEETTATPVSDMKSSPVASDTKAALVHQEPKKVVIEQQTERDEEESARILADFKPHEMVDQIAGFLQQEAEIKLRVSQLAHLKLDISSLEAVKHLKDRSHGNDFSNHFDDSFMKLEELIKRQADHVENQRILLKTLTLSETFYEEQYREAKIVANAYKNFGARINNMKKKLDDMKRNMPEVDSPILSPDVNAPSPVSTPPHTSRSSYTYNPATPMDYGQGLLQKSWMYTDTGSMSGTSVVNVMSQDSDSFPGSPPEETPSPEASPPDQSLDGSDNASGSLESRLASFFDRRRSDTSEPPVYKPQLAHTIGISNRSKVGGDDRSTPPRDDDDETPTTPVQDEHLVSPPKWNTPPKKENPIDFLSRLITQTQTAPVKTGTQTFLDSLTMLTMASKKPPDTDTQPQQMVTTSQSWSTWKSKVNDNTSPSQPSSPSSYTPSSSLPTSPTQFPPVLTMAPPPITMAAPPPIPMTAPPPVPLGISLNMPPPPPPFVLTQALPTNFSNPPPSYQQTSPGQKENWPDVQRVEAGDLSNSFRATHNSVLKELVPADEMLAQSGPQLDHSGMEIVDEVSQRSNAETTVESNAEFGHKVKAKTPQGALKSHVFMPNPERPNLMTLTVSDDLDESEMIDDDTVMENTTPAWSDKSDKSGHRSRSQSRDRDTTYKKKEVDEWDESDEDSSRLSVPDNEHNSGEGSVVQKIETNVVRTIPQGDRGEKYDDYWKNIGRKNDRYDQGGYRGRGDYRSFRNNRGGKDSVQAYAQAYREALFQQYNQARFTHFLAGPPPMGPWRPGYGQF